MAGACVRQDYACLSSTYRITEQESGLACLANAGRMSNVVMVVRSVLFIYFTRLRCYNLQMYSIFTGE